jgi:hypothetical protein
MYELCCGGNMSTPERESERRRNMRERERETGRRGAATHSREASSAFRSAYQQFV